ncbi:MAG TPA: PKD domain-containing protein [Candidatus Saccharimonadales bacterium]|nr:PKD domain-containing protein [Candidatus Saccharimonadales bacterium]
MKKAIIILAVFLVLSLLYPAYSYAHGSGFPPFFKIDDKIADPYFLQSVGVFSSDLTIPQDTAGKNFLQGEQLNFEIDESRIGTVYTPDVMDKIKYKWDFGDSDHADGVKNSHVYKKNGSYILTITADYHDPNTPDQLIESLLINIVPDKNYQLPKSAIKVNGKSSNEKNYNILDFDLVNSLSFDGSGSYSKSSQLVKYSWDFGDDKTGNGISSNHEYELPQAFATVVLRVYDQNGFFADSYVNIRNSGKNDPNAQSENSKINPRIIVIGIVAVLILIALVLMIKFRSGKEKN